MLNWPVSQGERILDMEEFSVDYFETAMQHGEMLVEIELPAPPPHTGAAYTKFNIIASDMATVSVASCVTLGRGRYLHRYPHCPGRRRAATDARESRRSNPERQEDYRCLTEKSRTGRF
jgi:CO/xanthine dehydrogenase FAD-binding subunit